MKNLSAYIITLSDRASRGVYEDLSGAELMQILNEFMKSNSIHCTIDRKIIPDDAALLKATFLTAVNNNNDFIFTTGGTGIGPRDITPDVIRPLLKTEIPGIMEVIRVKYGLQFPSAALSRSVAGIAEQSLVYCLPGNPKAVREYMREINKTLLHCYKLIRGEETPHKV
jgi:molybdenum cofactor synthesis domain-containing protein